MVYGHPNGVNCVKGEIHNVLSVMRVNARWATAARFKREIPTHTQSALLRRFKDLHLSLEGVIDLSDVDTLNVLEPFVHVVESEKTSGIITGAAISSLNKFLLYGLIPPDGLRATEAINRIALCVSRCRFEETHRDIDEMVLMKLLELLEFCLRCEAGPLISGDNVWKMVHTCYSICIQPRASMHLIHMAENTLAHVILTVFDRIADMDAPLPPPIAAADMLPPDDEDAPPEGQELSEVVLPYGIPVLEQLLAFLSDLIKPRGKEDTIIFGLSLINLVLETAGTGLGAHPALVSVLQGDLSKYLLQNSETQELQVLSLTLRVVFNLFNSIKDHLKVQLEVFFTSVHMRIMDHPTCTHEQKELALESLLEFCREPALMLDLYINYDCDVHCTNLFEVLCTALGQTAQVIYFPEQPPVFNILNLLALEGLLAVLESIARRCHHHCHPTKDVTGSDLAAFVDPTNNALASSMTLQAISPMSSIQEVMHLVMSDTESDSGDANIPPNDSLAWLHTARERTAEVLQQRKQNKKRYFLAAEKFHTEPKNWIAYSQQLGLLPNPITAESVASFFHQTPILNKTSIGDYLGDGPKEDKPFHEAVRNAYVAMFDFRKAPLDAALRMCLAKFRLPGEAQKIDRLMEAFAKEFFQQNEHEDHPFAHEDCAFILSFSIIMLNTDLHSDQIQKKMTIDEFVRNNRGINAGQDLPREYLVLLYNNIQSNQIKMQTDISDMQDNTTVDRYSEQWDGILKRQENVVGASFTSNASVLKLRAGRHEREMFSLIVENTTESILNAFERTCDETTMQKALDGIVNCIKIAVYFNMPMEFNKFLAALAAYVVEFAHGVLNGDKVHPPLGVQTDQPDDFDDRASRLKTTRTLKALHVLFDVVWQYADALTVASWTNIVECMLLFNTLDICPASLVEMDDFVDARGVPFPPTQLSPKALHSKSGKLRERTRRLAERQAAHRQTMPSSSSSSAHPSSFWDSLSYWWSEEEAEADANYPLVSQALREAVASCGQGLLERDAWLKFCRKMNGRSVESLLEALLHRPDESDEGGMVQENAMLALEWSTNVVLVNLHRFGSLWPLMHGYVAAVLAENSKPLLVERVVVNVLRVCIRLFHDADARPLLLDTLVLLKSLDSPMWQVLAERVATGLQLLLKANLMYMHTLSFQTWEMLFGLLGLVAQYPSGWTATLDAIRQLQQDGVPKEMVGLWTGVCMRLINQRTGVEGEALKLLYAVANSEAADGCWIDLMRILLSYLQDERPAVAKMAWDCLYRSLMVPGVKIASPVWKDCFEEIIYTLDDRSRPSHGTTKDTRDMSLYSTTLLSKVFLYNIHTLAELDCFDELWLNVLTRLATKLQTPPPTVPQDVEVYETTLHSLRNLLVVMTAEGIFDTRREASLLALSHQVIRSISPHVMEALEDKEEDDDDGRAGDAAQVGDAATEPPVDTTLP
ncbi:Aste57867_8677 [Aphanomyces stellatus]|uniref:Aste57867_8677 protein n=1 Tax=Aphanomyces stellatus TaxID=120398 RepID=A0A485KL96_9STRA|nr:hypothetical protein As57867_008643 [Aphanomyces stellatus]VFT85563.1 Aste57867_8677 [Aphanomyces stellatus]